MEYDTYMYSNVSDPPLIKGGELGLVLKLEAPLWHSIISMTQQTETHARSGRMSEDTACSTGPKKHFKLH